MTAVTMPYQNDGSWTETEVARSSKHSNERPARSMAAAELKGQGAKIKHGDTEDPYIATERGTRA